MAVIDDLGTGETRIVAGGVTTRSACTPEYAEQCKLEERRKYHERMLKRHEGRLKFLKAYLPTLTRPVIAYELEMVMYHGKVHMIDEQTGGY